MNLALISSVRVRDDKCGLGQTHVRAALEDKVEQVFVSVLLDRGSRMEICCCIHQLKLEVHHITIWIGECTLTLNM